MDNGRAVVDLFYNTATGSYQAVPVSEFNYLSDPPGRKATKPMATRAIFPEELTAGWRWAEWGDDDRWPTMVREKVESVPMAGQAIYKLAAMMYGDGIGYVRRSDLQEGILKPTYIQSVDQFLRRNFIPLNFFIPQATDYRYYMNCFSEMILSNDRKMITGLYAKSAEHCRLTIQNPKTLTSDYLLYSPGFACAWAKETEIMRIPLYDWMDEERFFSRLSGRKFAWHSKWWTPGHNYYARPLWTGLFRKDGWLDASIAVPEIVNAMMRNQISLKYQIFIPESYFTIRHPQWDSYGTEKQQRIFKGMVKKINDLLSGTKNAARSLAFYFHEDPISKNPMGKVEIVAIDDKIKRDSWVPSADKSDAQVVQGFGLHPSQVGLAPEGGKMGAGSGSDQRESFNTQISINTIDQEIVLSPLQFVADYNARTYPEDWDIVFYIKHTRHTTTDISPTGFQQDTTTSPNQPTS